MAFASGIIPAMHILLSNDDGVYAPGLAALREAVKDLGDVRVVAPSGEQSAVGHAITLSDPIKTKKIFRNGSFFGHAVGGTPADCVKLAACALLDHRPDLVISGINLGPNAGISVIYSGTVSAATEGTILGIPSMAISIATFKDPVWETAAHVARHLAALILKNGLPPRTLLNVNVPNLPLARIRGFAVTHMGESRFVETFDRRTDPRGNEYFWMDGELEQYGEMAGSDLQALNDGFVSLTPIWFDLTNRDALPVLKRWPLDRPAAWPVA
ncbi:MAG TPA: 5'/3'-nucleotidase SurE [Kiritimatiellia bacterium]|nr:5'/3'-nucleotidase SurE [Kiritimatiellia bacterium]HRZ12032.1 5'/3'-nucleotidase SurE [Kiritimatiellia bacterium]HSA17162.1 5'/3'-nucleotidase SurE [Kiritimatiellia bacterium]